MPDEVKPYLSEPTSHIDFEFFNPTHALAVLLCLSPLAASNENLQLFARHSAWYEDYCDGERMHRVQNSLPEGCAALSSILFFDGILRDAKGNRVTYKTSASHKIVSHHITYIHIGSHSIILHTITYNYLPSNHI